MEQRLRGTGKGVAGNAATILKFEVKFMIILIKKRRCLNFLRKTLSILTCTTAKSLMQLLKLIRDSRKLKMSSINLKRLSR
jgi:hypothetical protein